MILSSSAFAYGGEIPARFTWVSENVSPPLRWTQPPQETKSFALVCVDEDANDGARYYWAAYDIPSYHDNLGEGAGKPGGFEDFRHAVNDFEHFGYGGPRPTPRPGIHHYSFYLFALDCASLSVRTHPRCDEVLREARKHALATSRLVSICYWR